MCLTYDFVKTPVSSATVSDLKPDEYSYDIRQYMQCKYSIMPPLSQINL